MGAFIKDKFTQDLSAGALTNSFTVPENAILMQILIHASVEISESITITHDAKFEGANYDTVLRLTTLTSEQDYVFRPEGKCFFEAGDIVKIQCSNANATGIVYGKLQMKREC